MRFSLYVLTTTGCNFDCNYCFERGIKRANISQSVLDQAVSFFANRLQSDAGIEEFDVTLFGGEPTLSNLCLESARRFHGLGGELGLDYTMGIITNGYLLGERLQEELLKVGLTRASITVDGPRDVHDSQRPLRGGQGTYDVIMANVALASSKMKVTVRVNYYPGQTDVVIPIFDELSTIGVRHVYLGPVRPNLSETCGNIPLTRRDREDLMKLVLAAKSVGLHVVNNTDLGPCMAHSEYAVAMGPDGKLYNCLFGVGRDVCQVGNISTGFSPKSILVNHDYLRGTPCLDCEELEHCYGGCRYDAYLTTGSFEGRLCKKAALVSMQDIVSKGRP